MIVLMKISNALLSRVSERSEFSTAHLLIEFRLSKITEGVASRGGYSHEPFRITFSLLYRGFALKSLLQ